MDSPVIIGVIFLCVLIIVGVIIGVIIFIVPKTKVKLHNPCFNQNDCDIGLVCSSMGATGPAMCLSGIEQPCESNTDCAFSLVCFPDSHVCAPPLTITSSINPFFIESVGLSVPLIFGSGINMINTINTKMKPITSIDQLK